jgi:hypothetical protein
VAPDAEVAPRSTVQRPGDRRQGDRRQRDGLGILPRARTADEAEYRARLNKLGGFFLSGFGALVAGGGGSLLASGSTLNGISGLALGATLLARGLYVIGQRERRRRGRRRVRSRGEAMDLIRSSSALEAKKAKTAHSAAS